MEEHEKLYVFSHYRKSWCNRHLRYWRQRIEAEATIHFFQRRPNTFVVVRWDAPNSLEYSAVDFAKIKRPDVWSARRGYEVAVGKATHRIAAAYLNGESLHDQPLRVHTEGMQQVPYELKVIPRPSE